MKPLTTGLLLSLTLLGIFACAFVQSLYPHQAAPFVIAMILMVPMCYLAEKLDGGMPRFYEDLHRKDGHV